MNKSKDALVKAHGEKFNLNILKLKSLKSSFPIKEELILEDSDDLEESLEYISNEEALEIYDESFEESFDKNYKKVSKPTKVKKNGSSLLCGVKTYLPLEYHSAVELYKGSRKNATLGSGIVNIVKQFFSLKARSDIQVKKFVQVLTKIELEINNLSILKMKNSSKELIVQQEEIIYRNSKNLINLMDLMAYSYEDLKEMLPINCRPSLEYSINLADRKDREYKSGLINVVDNVNQ